MAQFIDMCILCGCDYMDSIRGMGPVTAHKHKKSSSNRKPSVQDGHLVDGSTRAHKEHLSQPAKLTSDYGSANTVTDSAPDSIESNRDVSFDLDALSNLPSVIILTQNATSIVQNSVNNETVPEETTLIPTENPLEGSSNIPDALLSEVVPEATSPMLVRSRAVKNPLIVDFNGKSYVSNPPSSSSTSPSAVVDDESTSNLDEQDTVSGNTDSVSPPLPLPPPSVVLNDSDLGISDSCIGFQVYPPPSQVHERLRVIQLANDKNTHHPNAYLPTTLVPFKKRGVYSSPAVDVVPELQPLVILDAEDTEEMGGPRLVSFDATPPAPPPTPPRPSQSELGQLEIDKSLRTASIVPFTGSPLANSAPAVDFPATRLNPKVDDKSLVADSSSVKFRRTPPTPPNTNNIEQKTDIESEISDGSVIDNVPDVIVAPQPVILRIPADELVDHYGNATDTASTVTNSSDEYEDSESNNANGKYIPWYCEGQIDEELDAGDMLKCLYISADGRTKCNHARCVDRRRRRRKLLRRGEEEVSRINHN